MGICATVEGYAQSVLWEKTLGGQQSEYLLDAIATPDSGFLLAGSSISNKSDSKTEEGRGNYDYWIQKMDLHGNPEWQKSFGGSGFDYLHRVQMTTDGGYILAGTSNSANDYDKKSVAKGGFDFWVIRIDPKGNEIWQRTLGGGGDEYLHSVLCSADGGFLLGGSSNSGKTKADTDGKIDPYGKTESCRGNEDLWLVKLDKEGTVEWQKTYGGLYTDAAKVVLPSKKGGYIIGGTTQSPKGKGKKSDHYGLSDYWLLEIDKYGELVWEKNLGSNQDDVLTAMTTTRDGGYILGGYSNSDAMHSKTIGNANGTDFWVIKTDSDGVISWQKTFDTGKLDLLTSILENPDGSIMIGGYAQPEPKGANSTDLLGKIGVGKGQEGISDYIGLKINAKGEEIWKKTVGSKGDEVLRKLFETRDGGLVFIGTSNGAASGEKTKSIGKDDYWIVKLKDIAKAEVAMATVEAMPNPASSYTNIVLNFDYTSGTASLYDLSGRLVRSEEIKGNRMIPMEIGNLPEGVYVIQVKTDVNDESIKIIKR